MKRLQIAVQKSGRLLDDSLALLKECGLKIPSPQGQLKASVDNYPLDILFLRNSDIPQYVQDGVADIAIIGENLLVEDDADVVNIMSLGFSKCRVSLAAPKASGIKSVKDFEGKKIATSYPTTLRKYLTEKGVNASIHTISGSVEIAPTIGLADGICDIVSTGNTLFMNGLEEVEKILFSQAVLIANKSLDAEAKALLDKLVFRIKSVLEAKNTKYVLLNAPENRLEEIIQILPGVKSPTVMPLAEKGWLSVHSVITEDQFWQNIDALKAAGAEGILIVPIEKMVR
ncbi:MAG: ATP phosphoribosyltransferase [Crocinitomicaceae bacterium]|nr:ATP phosphoribosyltransferase [Crocinitomicaceae bacterium]